MLLVSAIALICWLRWRKAPERRQSVLFWILMGVAGAGVWPLTGLFYGWPLVVAYLAYAGGATLSGFLFVRTERMVSSHSSEEEPQG
jgi:hypothetical protein